MSRYRSLSSLIRSLVLAFLFACPNWPVSSDHDEVYGEVVGLGDMGVVEVDVEDIEMMIIVISRGAGATQRDCKCSVVLMNMSGGIVQS